MNKIIIPIMIIFLLLSTSFAGISYDVEKMEVPPATTGDGGLMNSSWPMKCHDLRHTSQSPYSTADNPGTEKWRFRTDDCIESSPIIGNDGIIYVGDFDRYLYAIYLNGTEKWRYQTGGWIWSTPAIAEDGTIYVNSFDDYLYAINPNGTRKWRFCAHDSITSSPAIAEDGTIYFGVMGPNENGRINAINPNGTEKWHYDTDFWIVSDPAVGDDGTIYIGSGDSYLYALYPNGTLRWRFKTGDDVKGHPSIAEDGTIYVGSFDYLLYAINPNGTLKWKRDGDYCGSSSVAIGNDGILYFGSLYAAYPNNGTTKWSLDLPNNYFSSHAISADGTIYVSAGGCLIAVNPNGTEKWRKYIGKAESCPVIAEDGTIYIGSGQDDFGYLHAFGKGPLAVDAGGPYSGNAEEPIQFSGDVFGGVLPYDYHWEFGDGNTSDLEDPEHTYSESGEYIATFTVIDGDENSSSDTANVTVGTSRPTVKITKPENALYLLNMKILPLSKPLIIGRIDIEVDASQGEVGIDRVEFYIDDELKFTDFDEPYSWTWKDKVFFKHTIKVIAIDNAQKSSSDEIAVRKFF